MRVWKPNQQEIESTREWGEWGKEKSEFAWHYDEKETCYILEGEAQAWDKDGNQINFKAGDMVEFEQGLDCTWKISKDIRKKFMFG